MRTRKEYQRIFKILNIPFRVNTLKNYEITLNKFLRENDYLIPFINTNDLEEAYKLYTTTDKPDHLKREALQKYFDPSNDRINNDYHLFIEIQEEEIENNLKLLNNRINNFIENECVLINYYGGKINKSIITKHCTNLKMINIYSYIEDNLYDHDLVCLNKLELLVLPVGRNITDTEAR